MKTKKVLSKVVLLCVLFLGTIVTVGAASGSGYCGGNNGVSISKKWHTGWNIQGDYTMATATNRPNQAAYQKRVFARSGVEGSYSSWVRGGTHSISVKDFGPYNLIYMMLGFIGIMIIDFK